jgi:hypothetical protein
MSFLEVLGIAVPVRKNSWPGKPLFVGQDVTRALDAALCEGRRRRVREWSGVKMVFLEPETAHALRALLEGQFLAVSFDDGTHSFDGIEPAAGGSYTQSATDGKHGGRLSVSSNNHIAYALEDELGVPGGWFPVKGWTVICWKRLTTTDDGIGGAGAYYHHIATGAVAVTQGASANPADVTQYRNGVAGSYSMGNWLQVLDGEVRLYGKDNDGTNNAKDYDELLVLPFALPAAVADAWAASIYAFMDAHAVGRAPFVKIAGDCIPDASPLEVRFRVTAEHNVNVWLAGTHYNNALELECDVRER